MREKIAILSILFLLPMRAYCTPDCAGKNQTECWGTPGCQYATNTGCTLCPAGWYCDGDETNNCNSISQGNFPNSDPGSISSDDCYRNLNTPCEKQDGTSDNGCRNYMFGGYMCGENHDIPAHEENDQCYYNTRNCNKFSTSGCGNGTVSGVATYANNAWTINSCACNATDFEDTTNRFCRGLQGGSIPSAATISYATNMINYDTSTGEYYCTRCIRDNGNTKYYANTQYSNTECEPDIANGRACKCETKTDKGFWRHGTCASDTDWTNQNDICISSACGAGQTTSEILPIAQNASDVCHYTSETQFCDSMGCFGLGTGAGNWNAAD